MAHPRIVDECLTVWRRVYGGGPPLPLERGAWIEALGSIPDDVAHDVARGWLADQSWMPTPNTILERCQSVLRQRASDRMALADRHRCPECRASLRLAADGSTIGSGVVEIDDDGRGSVRPCHLCNADAYDRWSAGVYRLSSPSYDEVPGQSVAAIRRMRDLLSAARPHTTQEP